MGSCIMMVSRTETVRGATRHGRANAARQHYPWSETDVEDVHELVEFVDSGGFDLIEAGDILQSCSEPLRALDGEECLAKREGLVG